MNTMEYQRRLQIDPFTPPITARPRSIGAAARAADTTAPGRRRKRPVDRPRSTGVRGRRKPETRQVERC